MLKCTVEMNAYLESRRLPGPVDAEQPKALALAHGEASPVDGRDRLLALRRQRRALVHLGQVDHPQRRPARAPVQHPPLLPRHVVVLQSRRLGSIVVVVCGLSGVCFVVALDAGQVEAERGERRGGGGAEDAEEDDLHRVAHPGAAADRREPEVGQPAALWPARKERRDEEKNKMKGLEQR